MGLIADWVHFNAGNECPESFTLWSGMTLLSTIVSRKVWYNRDYFYVLPNIYTSLIGSAGSGKTTAKDIARDVLVEHFVNVPLSASVTSREDVAKFMGSDDGIRTFHKDNGEIVEYHPFAFYVDELANLLSVDMRKMVDFLVELYNGKYFSTSFKNTGSDKIPNPYATMLSCAVPDWVMRTLKLDLFTGGLGRRLIMVVDESTKAIAHPKIPEGGTEALTRTVTHLKRLNTESFSGAFSMTPEGDKWWVSWYEGSNSPKRRKPDDPILKQLYSTKHVMVLKVAMLLALEDYNPRFAMTEVDLQRALAMLDLLEPKIKEFSAGVGRNELAAVSVQFLDAVKALGGQVMEKRLRAMFFRECKVQGREYDAMVEHLAKTDQIVLLDVITNTGFSKTIVFTPERYEEYKKTNGAAEVKKPDDAALPPGLQS